jgi:glycosyltransferase involved in cell wall biosynthesis
MKIAVVHDYFTQMGGAEKVAEELYRMAPGATLVSTVALEDRMPATLHGATVQTSWMQRMPGMKKYFRLYFLFYPLAVRSLDLSRYDLVLSSSSGYAKGVHTHRDALHVCYCHTPMRWAWNFNEYSAREHMGLARKTVLPALISMLRRWDKGASRQPDHFIANSQTVAKRIAQVYGRAAEVIHPPVDVDRFRVSSEQDDYYIVLSRLVSYKRIDLAVKACTLLNRQLIVIGEGTNRKQLMEQAGPTVKFMGRLSDADVEHFVSRCRALIFPGEEDFGIAPLEVAAAGRPCIAYRAGGALETILDGDTGLFFDEQTPEALAACIEEFERRDWSPVALQLHARNFRREVFQERMRHFLDRAGCPLPAVESQLSLLNASVGTQADRICA